MSTTRPRRDDAPGSSSIPAPRRVPRASLALTTPFFRAPATPAPARRKAWRQSILDGQFKRVELEQREEFVRGPASAALEALLEVGEEGTRLDEERRMQYAAFEGVKKAYLSPALFLSAPDLADLHPTALQDPQSPLNTLIKLSNLTTFLYLVLSSAPDPTGARPKTSVQALREATNAFLPYVVPVDSPIHDGVLKMLVALKCQAYLAACSRSRTPVPPEDFLTQLLSDHLPLPASDPLANRNSANRFNTYCRAALDLIRETGADRETLETRWKWGDVEGELRRYCEGVARAFGGSLEGSESEREEESGREEEREVEEQLGMEVESGGSEEGSGSPEGSGSENDDGSASEEEGVKRSDEDEDGSDDDEDDEDDEEEKEKEDDEDDEQDEEDELEVVARIHHSPTSSERAVAESLGHPSSPVKLARDDPSLDSFTAAETYDEPRRQRIREFNEMNEDVDEEEQPEVEEETAEVAETYDAQKREWTREFKEAREELGEEEEEDSEDEGEESYAVDTQAANNGSELSALMDEDDSEEDVAEDDEGFTVDIQAPAGGRELHAAEEDVLTDAEAPPAPRDPVDADDEALTVNTQLPSRAQELAALQAELDDDVTPLSHAGQLPARKALRVRDGIISRVPAGPKKPSMLDAQPDAVQVQFDSQSLAPSSPPLAKSKSKPSKKDKADAKKDKGKGRAPRSLSSETGRGRTKSVVQESESSPAVEGVEQVEEVDMAFDYGDFGGGAKEDQREPSPIDAGDGFEERRPTADADEDSVVAPVRRKAKLKPVVEILVRKHKDKGKQKALPQRQDTPVFDLDLPEDDEMVLALVASMGPSQARVASSHPTAGPSRERAVAGPSRDRPSTASPVAGSSKSRAIAGLSKPSKKRRSSPSEDEDDGFGVQSDESDEELVRRNRQRKRKLPVEDDDDADFDSTRKERAEKRKKNRRRSSPVDEDSEDSDAPLERGYNHYRLGRNKPGGRVGWTDKEERLLLREMEEWKCKWATINDRHGKNGYISTKLKFRNPVSLKDKARNIKMALVKAGRPVPSFMDDVPIPKKKSPPTPQQTATPPSD